MTTPSGFHCRTCNNWHTDLPLVFGPDEPEVWKEVQDWEKERRCKLDANLAVLDGERYFIRGCLERPILESTEVFTWLVWASLKRHDFAVTIQHWETEGREADPPFKSSLCSEIPGYPPTRGLAAKIQTRPIGLRPLVTLEASDHPLAAEQSTGISWDRVQELASIALHPGTHAEGRVSKA